MLRCQFQTLGIFLAGAFFIACGPSGHKDNEVDAGCTACDETFANDCVDGRCSCVSPDGSRVSDACDRPSVCDVETGLCLTPDPLGEPCDEVEGILCDNSSKVCVDSYCTVVDCDHPEICDLLDNNCDGWLDELPGGGDLITNCYSGPPETVDIGNCSIGSRFCVAGNWTLCQGEQLPVAENGVLACDGQDNDCNDCIDDRVIDGMLVCGVRPVFKTDFVFIIDISGSMDDNIAATVTAIDSFGSTYAAVSELRWSIERVAITTAVGTLVDVYHALSDFPLFQTALASLPIVGGGGTEPTYDAVWKTATGEFDGDLGVDPKAVPIYVIFTDEPAQTLLDLTEAEVCQAVDAKNAILVVFTMVDDFDYSIDWDECATFIFSLSNDPMTMFTNLNNVFSLICGI